MTSRLQRYVRAVKKSIAPLPEQNEGHKISFRSFPEALQVYRETWSIFYGNSSEPKKETLDDESSSATLQKSLSNPEDFGRDLAKTSRQSSKQLQEIAKEYGLVFRDTLYSFLQGYKEGKEMEVSKGVIEHEELETSVYSKKNSN